MSIDLNADLGESFGRWTLGDDDAMLGHDHQRERGLRFPRRRSGHPAADLPPRSSAAS